MRYISPSWLFVALVLAVTNEARAAGCYMIPQGSQDATNKTSGPAAAGNKAPYEQTLAGQGNSAVYSWSHDNVWNLAYTFNDPQAGARLPTSDDYVETYVPNSGGSATPSSSICDPITLPNVRVIAPYTGGWSQYVVVTNREPPPSGGGASGRSSENLPQLRARNRRIPTLHVQIAITRLGRWLREMRLPHLRVRIIGAEFTSSSMVRVLPRSG